MKLIKISATEARNNFFELIEMVAYKNIPVVVKRNNKDFIRIVAEKKPASSLISVDSLIKDTFGMCLKTKWPYEDKKIIEKEKKANKGW